MNALTPLSLFSRFVSKPAAPAPDTGLTGERLARARLARTPRIGPVSFHEMLGHFGSAEAALEELPALARRAGLDRAASAPSAAAILREAEALAKLGGRFVLIDDPDYPALLAQIADAPPLLSVLGDSALLSRAAIAIVGARNASVNGRRLATTFAADLGRAGYVVVSGLARGIDTEAHRSSMPFGTVTVLAGGVDVVYPPENEPLYREIAARGAIVSEAPLGAVPQARHFPRRNRIVSGLAAGVLVVEAALQSGSLITARQAADQGRDVFAIPGSPLDPRARGTNRLIRDGAHLVEEPADVLAHLPAPDVPIMATPRDHATRPETGPARPLDSLRNRRKSPLRAGTDREHNPADLPCDHSDNVLANVPYRLENADSSVPSTDLAKVLACLGPSPTPVDEVIRRCHVSPAAVTALLLDLELDGRLERQRGNLVALVG